MNIGTPLGKRIFVHGYFGFGNLGDEAILEGIVAEVRRRIPEIAIVAVSGNPEQTRRRLRIDTVDFFDLSSIAAQVEAATVVLFGAGGVFQDYWGAHAAAMFQPEADGLEAYLRPALLAQVSGVPAVMFCAGIGPLRTPEGRRLVALACRLAADVIVRDERSAAEARTAGFVDPISVAADPAFLVTATATDARVVADRLARTSVASRPFVAFALRVWPREDDTPISGDELVAAAVRAVDTLPAHYASVFVPFHHNSRSRDVEVAAAAVDALGRRAALFDVRTPGEAVALFARADAVVAVRAHAVLFAGVAGVPAVSIPYDPKVSSVADALALAHLIVAPEAIGRSDERGLAATLRRAVADAPQAASSVVTACTTRVVAARAAFDRVQAILDRAPDGPPVRQLGSPSRRPTRRSRLADVAAGVRRQTRLIVDRATRVLAGTIERGGAKPSVETAARDGARCHDIACLPIIDWDFRFQRPQQLMTALAAAGHRVFYVAQTRRARGLPYEIEEKAPHVYEVALAWPRRNIYRDVLDPDACDALFASLNALRRDMSLGATAVVAQLPFWAPLAARAWHGLGWPTIYDCMDDHAGFSTNSPAMVACEEGILDEARLVLASSALLEERCRRRSSRVLRLPNACDYERFARVGPAPGAARPVVGYFGAISDWFDVELVADLAHRRPEWDFHLVGSTFGAEITGLSGLSNVRLLGERPYAMLPDFLQRCDALIVPFRRTPLTEATNPVKIYEMLASGRPVVSVPLPEVRVLGSLVRLASTADDFAEQLRAALGGEDAALVEQRRAFAREHTWKDRAGALIPVLHETFPLVSVVVVTYNNVTLTSLCLDSLEYASEWPHLDLVVMDNGSTDGTMEHLRERQARGQVIRVIENRINRGFAAAVNTGLSIARGEYLVVLNNDTVVTRGALAALVRHLRARPDVGLVGPVTNAIANEARVSVSYDDVADMPSWAARYVREHDGETFPLSMAAMFCVAMRRDVWDAVGPLDERFETGMFEDDDYSRRVKALGLEIRCARDAFVHHWQKASFNLLGDAEYRRIYEENRRKYEAKWAEPR